MGGESHERKLAKLETPLTGAATDCVLALPTPPQGGVILEHTSGGVITTNPVSGKSPRGGPSRIGSVSSPDLEAPARREGAQEQKHEAQERLKRGRDDEGQG